MINLVTSLLLALIPVDGQVFQEVAQEYDTQEECFDALFELEDYLADIDDLWITNHDYHTEVFNTETLNEYRIMCTQDTLTVEAS